MAPNRISEEPLPQPQHPMTSQTQQTGINSTASIRSGSNTFSFRSVPIGASGRILRLPVFPVIRVPAHSKAAAAAYAIDRIREEKKSSTITTMDIVVVVAVTLDGVNTTTVESEARISSTTVNKSFSHSNNFDGVG